MSDQRASKAEFAAWVGIIGNLALAAMKGTVGFFSGSKALIADAAHSASDILGSFAVLIGLKAAKKPPDKDHPYGHGKAETIAAMIVAILLLLVGYEIASGAVMAMLRGDVAAPEWYALIAIVISILVKEAMFQYKYRLGKKLSSQALIANAWEHRSDVYSSIAALIGAGGAVLGGYIDLPALYYLDPVAGIAVSLLIFRMGYKLFKESLHTVLDHVLHEEETAELLKTASMVKGVVAVDDLRAREHGHYVIVDIKLSVNPHISVLEGHEIGKAVKHRLMEQYDHVADVFVHINPFIPGYPYNDDGDSSKSFTALIH
ncbi:cation diffusion facilitator family transporter [Marinicrinis lubricantis]|uniref:Cation diffusion facilitator family transporter n=1 Tax=Marinicrinis lubricantis TaxID=2086470 RepID=A0ABW1ITR9_9BACL